MHHPVARHAILLAALASSCAVGAPSEPGASPDDASPLDPDASSATPDASPPADAAGPSGACARRPVGTYCGPRLGLDPNTLYACNGGADAISMGACTEGCDASGASAFDACYRAQCAGRASGLYCGADAVAGNPALLYRCAGDAAVSFSLCAGGCQTNRAGVDDVCIGGSSVAPAQVRAAAGDGSAVVHWDASVAAPGYTVAPSPGGASVHAGAGATGVRVTGLANGTGYSFVVTPDGGPASLPSNTVTPSSASNVVGDVAFFPQLRPLTCEEASLRMALTHAGIVRGEAAILDDVGVDPRPASVDASGALRWGDPYTSFVGDPGGSEVTRTGYGTYYPNIARVASSYGARVLQAGEQVAPEALYAAVLAGHPAVVWVGSDWAFHAAAMTWIAFDGRQLEWRGPYEHAVTLVGVTDDAVLIDNPLRPAEWQVISKATFEASYRTYNQMAVVLE